MSSYLTLKAFSPGKTKNNGKLPHINTIDAKFKQITIFSYDELENFIIIFYNFRFLTPRIFHLNGFCISAQMCCALSKKPNIVYNVVNMNTLIIYPENY